MDTSFCLLHISYTDTCINVLNISYMDTCIIEYLLCIIHILHGYMYQEDHFCIIHILHGYMYQGGPSLYYTYPTWIHVSGRTYPLSLFLLLQLSSDPLLLLLCHPVPLRHLVIEGSVGGTDFTARPGWLVDVRTSRTHPACRGLDQHCTQIR